MMYKTIQHTTLVIVAFAMVTSCTTDPNSPGVEYMTDMYRSPAIEAYVDYGEDPYYVTEEVAVSQRNQQSARKPVAGSIAFQGDDKAFGLPPTNSIWEEGLPTPSFSVFVFFVSFVITVCLGTLLC